MDSALRPRDIQARIRAGESPESVADAAGTTLERIMGFAAPVIAERDYVAQQAQRASVRRRVGSGPVGVLSEAVAGHLASRDIDPESVRWDSWRRDDGRWTVVAEYGAAPGTRAEFLYDVAGRYVVAADEESRRLVGERVPGAAATGLHVAPGTAEPAEPPGADPAAAQLPLGDDAIELVTGRRPEPADEPTVDLSRTAEAVRSAPPATGDADWMVTQATERPGRAARPQPTPEETQHALFESPEEPAGEPAPARDEDSPAATGDLPPEPDAAEPAPEPRRPRRQARGKGRASVPSWDEIMFGSQRGE